MNENAEPSSPREGGGASSVRGSFQFGLLALLLLMTVCGVWFAYFNGVRQNSLLRARITAMRATIRQVVVDDSNQVAAIRLEDYWPDEGRWKIYVPSNGKYRLCLATRNIDVAGLPAPVAQQVLEGGHHMVGVKKSFKDDGWLLVIQFNGEPLLNHKEPDSWNRGYGSEQQGVFATSVQFSNESPAVLSRARFTRPDGNGSRTTPPGPTEGILLWIEKVKEEAAE